MGRPRAFDEQAVIRAAAELFATRAYDGLSVDDLVTHLGVHRNSLYKTFGSKRGLYLTALRWSLRHQVWPLLAEIRAAAEPVAAVTAVVTAAAERTELDLLLLAAVERAPWDDEVAALVTDALTALDNAWRPSAAAAEPAAVTAALLGMRLRARARSVEPAAATATASTVADALLHPHA